MSVIAEHVPVMLPEVLATLAPSAGEIYVDGTLGAGGYSGAILERAPGCKVVGIDRDPDVIERLAGVDARLDVVHGNFGDLDVLATDQGFSAVDGVVLDIGVSSMQIDNFERGFSFRGDGPLDMRMDTSSGETAADIINNYEAGELEKIFRNYGQERHARKVAATVVRSRAEAPILSTGQLADLIRSVVPKSKADLQDPATRCFQALRIAVNDELGELRRGLEAAERVLKPDGRLVVVAFHSLEDSIVKEFLISHSGNSPQGSRHLPQVGEKNEPSFRLISRKAVKPSREEVAVNPRARSARLRAAIRTHAPVWEVRA